MQDFVRIKIVAIDWRNSQTLISEGVAVEEIDEKSVTVILVFSPR